jgi:NAD+ kinase
MKVRRVAVVVKLTALAALGRGRGPAAAAPLRRLVAADRQHRRTLDAVRRALDARGIPFDEDPVHRLTAAAARRIAVADLVIAVGGDGTLLAASHHVTRGALLGVNSAPRDSVGHFCTAHRRNLARTLDAILASALRPAPAPRLELILDGRHLPRALNDALVTHSSPAATTRYRLRVAGRAESQRSSGIWIATGAGSTAGILSAGGRAMPLRSRRMQYRVRELYREPGRRYALTGGVLPEGAGIVVESRMPEGRVYVDGARIAFDFPFGSRLVARIDRVPLALFSGRPKARARKARLRDSTERT